MRPSATSSERRSPSSGAMRRHSSSLELEPEQHREYLERIQGLTTRLGDLDQPDPRRNPSRRRPPDPRADADRVRRRSSRACAAISRLSGDDDRLVTDLSADLPPIEVDAPRVGRILENLVGNALKYGRRTSRRS